MKIWVIGKNGMLGSAICRLLEKKKNPFISSDKNEADITNLKSLENFIKNESISHIFNCAAYTNVDKAEKEHTLAHLVNASSLKNIVAMIEKISYFIVSSLE